MGHHLAEINVARLREPLESPTMTGLVRALSDINWLAEQSPGFVWRLQADESPLVYGQLDGTEVAVTISVWTHFEPLQKFVYRTAHGLFMQRRTRWFEPIGGFTTAMWWVPEGSEPSLDESMPRLEYLRAHGPSAHAFSLRQQFDPDGVRAGRREPVPPGRRDLLSRPES